MASIHLFHLRKSRNYSLVFTVWTWDLYHRFWLLDPFSTKTNKKIIFATIEHLYFVIYENYNSNNKTPHIHMIIVKIRMKIYTKHVQLNLCDCKNDNNNDIDNDNDNNDNNIIMTIMIMTITRTTRTPAFWDTPAAPWLPILGIHIRSKVKTRQSQNYKF